jgi:ATP-binding cassette subfamily B protein RaxB
MVAGFHGYEVDLLTLRSKFGISIKGMTLVTLIKIAEEMQLDARPVRAEVSALSTLKTPAILHWDFTHYVVLTKVNGIGSRASYRINDPAQGEITVSHEEILNRFTGVAVEISPTIAFLPRQERTRLSLAQLWTKATGFFSSIIQLLILSAIIELLSLAAPFYLQVAIDTAVPSHDGSLLIVIALGFGAAAILSQITSFVRSWASIRLSSDLSYQLVSNLFRHLVRLPVGWFQKRSVGDVLTRFNASQPITDLLSGGLVTSCIDGLMTLATLLLMLSYSVKLSIVTVIALLLCIVIRLAGFRTMKAMGVDFAQFQAREQSVLIESIRGITPIRIFGRENERQAIWQNRRAKVVNSQIRLARFQSIFSAIGAAILSIEGILFVYLAVKMNFESQFSVGMITAFAAYKQQFVSAAMNVVGKVFEYRLLDVQLARIGDIALTRPDPVAGGFRQREHLIERIELRGLCFSYGPGEPLVLSGVNLAIDPGETLAIVGPSGGGKTTLLRILLGLLEPTRGEILINGAAVPRGGLANYRGQIGAVMQDDQLFAGSLAQNISFFDPLVDLQKVRSAAQLAQVERDILAMPMQYDTLVGDMGSALSGGQKQRVLLARALYHGPQILVIDEGTANLDVDTERRVSKALNSLNITRIIVAHRPETIAAAGRRITLSNGKIAEDRASTEIALPCG